MGEELLSHSGPFYTQKVHIVNENPIPMALQIHMFSKSVLRVPLDRFTSPVCLGMISGS